MRNTNRQTNTRTLADLYRALDRKHAVTITYLKPGDTEPTVRTIEVFDIRTTKNGRIEVHAMCRLRGEARKFFLDRIVSYTPHRIAFVMERDEPVTVAGHVIPFRSSAQLIAHELGRDDFPRYRRTHQPTALEAA
ncbi:WYL domain-containing protein [Streptomyces sp. NPDC006551]|uniref:WYL domain-containing protein n=1 Tax=Streptomyces sp. NPDC006551 TaxID=3157178 RepID=UPI0033AF1294